MRSRNARREHSRRRRLDGDDFDARFFRFQISPDPRHRATRANASDKDVDIAIGIFEDLGPRVLKMRLGVGFIDELTRDKTVGNLFGEFVGLFDSPLHPLGPLGQDEFCAVCFHDLASFNRHRFGHDDDNAITARGGNRCQTNSRIPRCRLDDDRSFAQNAARLGVVDHRLRNAVFHRSRRVKILDLRQNPRL